MNLKKAHRVNYDEIAHLYDSQPYRDKKVDPEFLNFLETTTSKNISILDMGCGTGNQLTANRPYLPDGLMAGLDLFHGMLRQAAPKTDDIYWIQSDSAQPPFRDESFDFITNQYSFHHVHDKPAMIRAVYRLLRSGGRFVMENIDPRQMQDDVLYQYFPAALEIDLHDFLAKDSIVALMQDAGFNDVDAKATHYRFEQNLREILKGVKRRDTCSQLITIPDEDYQAGLRRLEQDIESAEQDLVRQIDICVLTVRARKA